MSSSQYQTDYYYNTPNVLMSRGHIYSKIKDILALAQSRPVQHITVHSSNQVQYWESNPLDDPFLDEDEDEDPFLDEDSISYPVTPPRPYRSSEQYNGIPVPRLSVPPLIPPRRFFPNPNPKPNLQCAFCSKSNIVYIFDCQHTICRDCGAGEKCPLCSVSPEVCSPEVCSPPPIEEVSCPLCLEIPHPSDIAILTCDCTTLYCPPCITRALQFDNRCPTCRKEGVQFVRLDTLELY
jgi:hypothetical protein